MTDRARRSELGQAYRASERQRRIALCPLAEGQLAAVVAHVDSMVLTNGCDHTTRHTEEWATLHGLAWADLVDGFAELGGHCDCEIVMNCDPGDVFGR